jgi:anthranilate synthase component 1
VGENVPVPATTTPLTAPVAPITGPTPAPHADLSWGQTWPSLQVFTELALEHRRVIPVVRRLLADSETPVGVYRKLARDEPGTFLLESAEHGGVWSRYSIVGARCAATLTEREGQTHWVGEPPTGLPTTGDPTQALRDTVAALATDRIAGLPPLTGGMVGAITYDAVRRWERVPDEGRDDLDLPELAMMLATDLAVFDHTDGSLLLVANAVNHDATDERIEDAWADAVTRLDRMTAELAASAPSTVATIEPTESEPTSSHTRARFEETVEQAKEAIRAGEAFQVVVSQRFTVPCRADALDVYRALRVSNPSPYMYLLRLPHPDGSSYDVVGSSPEALIKVSGRRAITHPIAGSRPRGKSPDHDAQLAEELLGDAKERAEHLMLVDLSRNDLQRICRAGTVDTVDFMSVRRYSHIMHIESTVVGDLRETCSAYDALVATFPAGTLSGAPKPRAMALIDGYEGVRRGLYGGVVGYLDFAGDLDMAIAIRTALIKDGLAHVQAGAGIVADSVPHLEFEETVHKAAAALRAVAAAEGLRPVAAAEGLRPVAGPATP